MPDFCLADKCSFKNKLPTNAIITDVPQLNNGYSIVPGMIDAA